MDLVIVRGGVQAKDIFVPFEASILRRAYRIELERRPLPPPPAVFTQSTVKGQGSDECISEDAKPEKNSKMADIP